MTKDSDKAAAKSAKKKKAASSGEREKEAAPTSNPDSDDEIVTLTQNTLDNLAKTIATAVATAMAQAAATPYVKTHSNALDPYDTASFDVSTKEGKYQWATMTKLQDGWKPITCNTESANILMDLFKDRQTHFGLDILLKIPTKGNGKAQTNPRTLAGVEHWDADLQDFKSLLVDIHSVSLDQVCAWSSWFYGGESQDLVASKDMLIHAIDPNKSGNQGLVNQHKIRLRRLSGALHFIAKNHLKRASYNSFYPNKDQFLFKDEVTGREYVCGLIFLKMMVEVMKPHLVVDHRAKETELEKMTLASCNNNVRTLLTSMQEKRNEIDTLRKDGVKYDEQRFLTLIFDCLSIVSCIDFKADVKAEKRKWIKDPTSVPSTTLIAECISLYTNYKSTGEWDAEVVDKDAVIVALAANLKLEKAKKSNQRKDAKQPSASGYTPLPDWRITKRGNTYTHEGTKYDWCTKHGPNNRRDDKKSSGMYMPHPHNHDDWAAQKKAKQDARGSKTPDASSKRKATEDKAGSSKRAAAASKLKLSSTLKSALVSKLQLSDAEANDVIACAMETSSDNEEADDNDDASK